MKRTEADTPMSYDDSAASTQAPEKKGRGCFFWGCIISLVILVVGTLAIGGGAYYLYRYVIGTLKEYSETTPAPIPPATMPEAERKVLHERFTAFGEALKKGEPVEPMILTTDDINALIEDNPETKGTAHVYIVGDQIKAEVSFPLKKLGIAELADRYLNGSAVLRVSLLNGELDIRADSVTTKGKPLPPDFLKAIQGQNLAGDTMKDPKRREALDKLSRIEVKDGKIIVTPTNAKKSTEPGDPGVHVEMTADPAAPVEKPADPAAPVEKPADPAAPAPEKP